MYVVQLSNKFSQVRWNSAAEFQTGGSVVVVKGVDCTGFDSNENSRPTISANVTFEFALSEGV